MTGKLSINLLPSAFENRDQHYANLNPCTTGIAGLDPPCEFVGSAWRLMGSLGGIYDEFLNVLPPLAWRNGSFCMCEMLSDDITSVFFQQSGRYLCGYLRMSQHDENLAAFRIKAAEL